MNAQDEQKANRRRKLLAFVLLLATSSLLLLNSIGLAARWASPKLAIGTGPLVDVFDAWLGGNEVRVYRRGLARYVANRLAGPVRVGLQVGHLDAHLQPDELENLRWSTGGHFDGLDEVTVNEQVANLLALRLRQHGFEVNILPATIPPGYSADLLLSIHVDASPDTTRQGYKSAHFMPARNPREAVLKVAVDRAMLAATNMADDDRNVSGNMLHYYAFNHRRFHHSVAPRTPALIVELGYLSNPFDRRLIERPDVLAVALEAGVLSYLQTVGRH